MPTSFSQTAPQLPNLGFGLGLRPQHYAELLDQNPQVDWLEIISENFMLEGGRALYFLDQFAERYRIVPHGVSLSIGSTDPLDWDYLKKLKKVVQKLDPPWFSDHLCWSKYNSFNLHNLMPLPYTPEVVSYVADRIRIIQDYMEKPFLLENVSSYVEFKDSAMPEWEFITRISEEADCGILLDVNNIFVSSFNHDFDPMAYINYVPTERVKQFHIAGHSDKGTYILDTHDHEIRDEVWKLYMEAAKRFKHVSVMIERDDKIPPLHDLLEELNYAKRLWHEALSEQAVESGTPSS
jgi:uncharacterized protein (UPF0276 family)